MDGFSRTAGFQEVEQDVRETSDAQASYLAPSDLGVSYLERPTRSAEYVHMLMCGECHEFSEACLKAGSFGEALGNWLAEHDIEQAS